MFAYRNHDRMHGQTCPCTFTTNTCPPPKRWTRRTNTQSLGWRMRTCTHMCKTSALWFTHQERHFMTSPSFDSECGSRCVAISNECNYACMHALHVCLMHTALSLSSTPLCVKVSCVTHMLRKQPEHFARFDLLHLMR
jgi:hypothetical protein